MEKKSAIHNPKTLVTSCSDLIAKQLDSCVKNKQTLSWLYSSPLPKEVSRLIRSTIIQDQFPQLAAAYQDPKKRTAIPEAYDDAHIISSVAISDDGYLIIGPYKRKTSLRSSSMFSSVPVINQAAVVLNQCGSEYAALIGHQAEITSVTISSGPISKALVATASEDKTARIWQAHDAHCQTVLTGHKGKITAIKLSSSGLFAVTGSKDGTVRIWDTKNGACLAVLAHEDVITALCLSLDGTLIASASADNQVRIWDVRTQQCLQILEGHHDGITCLQLSNDNKLLITGSRDCSMRIWNTETADCLDLFAGHTAPITGIDLSIDNSFVVSCSDDGTALIWLLATKQVIYTFETPSPLLAVAVSPDNSFVVLVSKIGCVYKFYIAQQIIEKVYMSFDFEQLVNCLMLTHERKAVIANSAQNHDILFELANSPSQALNASSLCTKITDLYEKVKNLIN